MKQIGDGELKEETWNLSIAAKVFTSFIIISRRPKNNRSIKFDNEYRSD